MVIAHLKEIFYVTNDDLSCPGLTTTMAGKAISFESGHNNLDSYFVKLEETASNNLSAEFLQCLKLNSDDTIAFYYEMNRYEVVVVI